jgi:hypothetical protein
MLTCCTFYDSPPPREAEDSKTQSTVSVAKGTSDRNTCKEGYGPRATPHNSPTSFLPEIEIQYAPVTLI